MAFNRATDVATIPSSGTNSTAVYVPTRRSLVGVQLPAAMTSTSMTFQSSNDDGATWVPIYNESTAYSLTIAASRYQSVNTQVFAGVSLLRVIGGSSEGAARDITLVFSD